VSSIGLEELVTSHDDLMLVSVSGGGGYVYDCDGDKLFNVPADQMAATEQNFSLIGRAYRIGHQHGEQCGQLSAQYAMRKALGVIQ
jgi:hypothetical protein